MSSDNATHRLGLIAVTALSLFGALFARLWFLQVVEGKSAEAQVTTNSTREVVIPAPRGRILADNDIVLVDNRESIVLAVDTQQYRELEERDQQRLLDRLATSLSRGRTGDDRVTVKFLQRRLNDGRFSQFRPVPVAEDLTVEQEIYFKEQADLYPTVVVEHHMVRSYPYGSLAAHVLGFVGQLSEDQWAKYKDHNDPQKPYEQGDEIGKSGVEATYEKYLRGTPGKQVFEVDRAGRVVREILSRRVEPKQGDDVHLSIDLRVQYQTEKALQTWIANSNSPTPAGAAVVLDPRNGQVKAMASYPTYNPADLVGGISQELFDQLTDPKTKALSNRAIQEAYPAASTFKLASSYAGLSMGLITPDGPVADPGFVQLCSPPRNDSGCLKRNSGGGAGMGTITLPTALTRSSDVYFYKLGVEAWRRHQNAGAPEDALQREIKVLGYGSKTGVDLTAETAGRVPTPASNRELADLLWEKSHANYDNKEENWQDARRWKAGYNADVAIGQFDTLVSPIQTANAYSSLANGDGRLYRPSVLSHINKANSATIVKPFAATVIRTIDWRDWRPALMAGFSGVAQSGGGTAARVFQGFPLDVWPVAGKTGTAEVGDDAKARRDNSLFVGFGPTPAPEYVASVMIEGGGFGAEAAAPAVRMIFEPIATGKILPGGLGDFRVPRQGVIDAEAASQESAGISVGGAD
jgi:penicillin-binding protein 2